MPMSRFSTLNYLINSYYKGKKEVEILPDVECDVENKTMNFDQDGFEPSEKSIAAILQFAAQYDVLRSKAAGPIELSLN